MLSNFQPVQLLLLFLTLVVAVAVHEFSHVLSAYLQGDQTGKLLGRLSLNPIKHLDPMGTAFMALAIFSGLGIGWGKPAPFNPYNLRFRRWGSALVAAAGPISNIIVLALSGYILLLVGPRLPSGNLLLELLKFFVIVNASLAVFNLIPIAPLDGSHILRAVLTSSNPLVAALDRYGFFILLGLVFLAGGLLSAYLGLGVSLLLKVLGLSGVFSLLV